MSVCARARGSRLLPGVAAAATVALVLTGCSGHKKPTPRASGTATGSATGGPGTAQALQNQVLATPTTSAPIATASADIHLIGIDSATTALTAQVVQVIVDGSTTVLHWQLKSTNGDTVAGSGNWASGGTSSATDTRKVSLLDLTGKLRLSPYVNAGQAVFGTSDCVCSETPRQVSGTPVDMYATFPAVSDATSAVTVQIPGFPAMANVPVTRP